MTAMYLPPCDAQYRRPHVAGLFSLRDADKRVGEGGSTLAYVRQGAAHDFAVFGLITVPAQGVSKNGSVRQYKSARAHKAPRATNASARHTEHRASYTLTT